MIALFRWITGFAIIIIFSGFAALNRQDVFLYYTPVHDPLTWPLYAIVLSFSAAGFLIGAFTVWLSDGKIRHAKRLQKKQIKTLENELKKTQTGVTAQNKPETPLFPALTKH